MKVIPIPCGPFANESERMAFEKLKSRVIGSPGTSSWIFLTNIPLSYHELGYSDEIDLLVVGPVGVIVIEVKHWDLKYIKENRAVVESQAERLNNKVKKIASKLRNSIEVGFIEGRILLTKGSNKIVNDDWKIVHGIAFYGLSECAEILNINAITKFDDQMIVNICKILEPKTKIALEGEIRTFAGFTNLELISEKDDKFHRIYKGLHILRRDKVILHLYDLSAFDEKNALELAKREYNTLQRLQKSPHLPRLLDSFQDVSEYPGELYYYSIIDPLVPNLIERSKDLTWLYKDRLHAVVNISKALYELHNPVDSNDPSIIHRNLSPESIRVKNDNQPIFTHLNLVKLPDGISISNTPIAYQEKEPYIAPEVLQGGLGAADVRSDIYSLCASLKLLFNDNTNTETIQMLDKGLAEVPDDRITLKELINYFEKLVGDEQPVIKEIQPVQYWDEDTIVPFKDSSYKILNKLGSGGIGTTFKVLEIDEECKEEYGTYVAKVIFTKEDGELALQAYRKVRSYSTHPHLAVIHEIAPQWKENSFVSLMKWVEGMPLSDLVGILPLYAEDLHENSTESFVLRWLIDLCDALSSLHKVGLVHGDMSPKNIIVSNGDVTLTDFDAVIESGNKPRIKAPHIYSSSNNQQNQTVSPSDDIFALAASFFHVLFEKEPFIFDGECRKDSGLNWSGINKEDWQILSKFFDKATDTNYNNRFTSASDAKNYITYLQSESKIYIEIPIIEEKTPTQSQNEVPRLLDILRSYPGSLIGNEETRGLDSEFAKQTYVETHLDRILYDEIINGSVNLVIMFGNAGDGKTAFLQHLAIKLGEKKLHSSKRFWSHTLPNGINVKINLDGSAAFQGKTATEVLDEDFNPFHSDPPKNLVHLIAINSGPLQAWIIDYESRYGKSTQLTEQLQDVLDGDISQLDPRFRFLDLNNRSLVGGIEWKSKSISSEFLDNIVNKLIGEDIEDHWKPCRTCTAQNCCTAWKSVQALRNNQNVRIRFQEALQAVHQRGKIHITARELRSALSYIFFGLYYCTDLHKKPDIDTGNYFDRAFDPSAKSRQGELLQELVFLDPSLEAHPKIDRYLLNQGCGQNNSEILSFHNSSLKSLRRRAFFECSQKEIEKVKSDESYFGLSQGNNLNEFGKVPLMSQEENERLCRKICKGIAKLEDLPMVAFKNDDGIPLKIIPRTPTESALWVIKSFLRFKLKAKIDSTIKGLEVMHTHLILTYSYESGGEEELLLGLELFHILAELSEGVQLSDAASEDVFANLTIFTQRLAQENCRELNAWNPIEERSVFKIKAVLKDNIHKMICVQQ